ncbi:MAG TPA: PaaI family thioesterase [Dehalococcoidia bacterium]|nr:PaaI family thioesterase [Dehalococcoidia bacterium]
MTATPGGASPRDLCYGCGPANPHGLAIAFELQAGEAVGRFTPRAEHQGFPGYVHGGVVAAALDEAMGWAVYHAGAWAITGRLEVRFRRPVPVGRPLEVRGRVKGARGRRLLAEARLLDGQGELLAEAEALFLRVGPAEAERLRASYGLAPGEGPSASP